MDIEQRASWLRQQPFLADLTQADLVALAKAMSVRHLQRGELLALEGEPCTAVYFVVQGRIRAFKMSPEGREQVVNALLPGQPFYLAPALDRGPLPLSTQADTRCTLLSLETATLLDLLHQQPSVLFAVAVSFAQRLRRLTGLVEDLSLRTVSQRVARLLLAQLEAGAAHRLTQQEMAAQLGTVREVVARTLAAFCQRGWIDLQRGRIEIRDLSALRQEAGGPM
jgi:CRP/FNR family transcriptional regulator